MRVGSVGKVAPHPKPAPSWCVSVISSGKAAWAPSPCHPSSPVTPSYCGPQSHGGWDGQVMGRGGREPSLHPQCRRSPASLVFPAPARPQCAVCSVCWEVVTAADLWDVSLLLLAYAAGTVIFEPEQPHKQIIKCLFFFPSPEADLSLLHELL